MLSKPIKLLVLVPILLGLAGQWSVAWAQRLDVCGPEQTWKYYEPTANILDGTGWAAPGYNDSAWPVGAGTFAWETTDSTLAFLQNNAPVNTTLEAPSGRTDYFRTTFHWEGPIAGVVLLLSNLVDDGAIIYLNGVEQQRLRLPADVPDVWNLFATGNPPGGDATAWEMVTLGSSNLVTGDNLLAVSVHQSSDISSDVVFAMQVTGIRPFAPILLEATQPTNAVVGQAQAHTLAVAADAFPEPELSMVLPAGRRRQFRRHLQRHQCGLHDQRHAIRQRGAITIARCRIPSALPPAEPTPSHTCQT